MLETQNHLFFWLNSPNRFFFMTARPARCHCFNYFLIICANAYKLERASSQSGFKLFSNVCLHIGKHNGTKLYELNKVIFVAVDHRCENKDMYYTFQWYIHPTKITGLGYENATVLYRLKHLVNTFRVRSIKARIIIYYILKEKMYV